MLRAALLYGGANLVSVVLIVVANKVILGTLGFRFPICLTWLHSAVTWAGLQAMARGGVFEPQHVPLQHSLPIAAAYTGFIAFSNISIHINTVGFFQITKIICTPAVAAAEYVLYGKPVGAQKAGAIAVLVLGICVATATDSAVASNLPGCLVAAAQVVSSVMYAVWAGYKQKQLGVSANALLHQVSPLAVLLLAALVAALEPVGWRARDPASILGYDYTPRAVGWIGLSSVLGLAVTLSTYLFIGATSPTTYSVVGNLKTLCILAAGMLLFGDELSLKKGAGLVCAMAGIVWYSRAELQAQATKT
ncbi:slc35e3 [Scenedesmus sp. PABB004]|nr:slc35e3 [Scenedesmus sp. PABB004]